MFWVGLVHGVPREEGVVVDIPQSQLRFLPRTTAEYIAMLTEKKGMLPTSAARYEVRRSAVLDLMELMVGGIEEMTASIICIPSPCEGYPSDWGSIEGNDLL